MLTFALLFSLSLNAFAAKVDTVAIYSASMKKNVKAVVITPASYKDKSKHFPVVYLLHGYSDSYSGWVKRVPGILNEADQYNMIIVCPDGAYGSWYFDSPIDSTKRYETNVAVEIPDYIDKHYRTIADRKARAITGLSMGGHGAFYLGIRHKDFFGAIGSMSGGVDIRPFPNNWDIKKSLGDYASNTDNWNKNTVINLVDQLKNDEQRIVIECGIDDFFLKVNRNLHEKLLAQKINHDYTERPGAHNWMYWSNAIKYQLLYFNNFFKAN
ncbi:MAG TPA: alpha/beta hydrolase family protein [Pedobacter sp.]|nr:alpha/beta hydrolase family protein [Pedobacter sp.]